jgi:hypothetical protein
MSIAIALGVKRVPFIVNGAGDCLVHLCGYRSDGMGRLCGERVTDKKRKRKPDTNTQPRAAWKCQNLEADRPWRLWMCQLNYT